MKIKHPSTKTMIILVIAGLVIITPTYFIAQSNGASNDVLLWITIIGAILLWLAYIVIARINYIKENRE